jgi:O-antigen/teichoic acid export membrane protein
MVMAKNNSIRNFIWNLIGLSAYSIVSLIMLIITSRINTIDEAGIVSYSFSIATLFFYFALFYNRVYQITNMSDDEYGEYLGTRITTTILSILLMFGFAVFSGFDHYKIIIMMLFMLFRAIDAISDCFYGYFQSKEKLYQAGISYTIKSTLGILVFLIIDLMTKNLAFSIVGLIGINLAIFFLYDLICFKKDTNKKLAKIRCKCSLNILKHSLPVFIFSFISIFLANAQKYIITYSGSNTEQAIFGIIVMPATMLSLVSGYLANPFMNKMKILAKAKKYQQFKKVLKSIIIALICISVPVILIGKYLGIPFLELIYGIDLNGYDTSLVVILIASTFYAMSIIFSSALTILGENKKQIIIYGISAASAFIPFLSMNSYSSIDMATASYFVSSMVLLIVFIAFYCLEVKSLNQG